MERVKPTAPMLFISPHLDDVVLSCAQLLSVNPEATVVTVLAGAPNGQHYGYNFKTTGKSFAPDAIDLRRREDAAALTSLSAKHLWLDFLDSDFLDGSRDMADRDAIRDVIGETVVKMGSHSVFVPLGLVHEDHVQVSDACVELAKHSDAEWYLYMDMPYGCAMPREVSRRIAKLETTFRLERLEPFRGEAGLKRSVLKLYFSQYDTTRRSHRRGFRAAMKSPEHYWRIVGTL